MNASNRLERAVKAIYPEIHRRATRTQDNSNERVLWKELSCCILSSQVKYSTASAAAEALDIAGALEGTVATAERIEVILRQPVLIEGRQHKYRFPRSKAIQLAATHDAVHNLNGGLVALLDSFKTAEDARLWLVNNAPGLGPKQASMFLRNSGMSYDLAVLDRHVIDFMRELGMPASSTAILSTLKGYSSREAVLRHYAQNLGMAVGLLDWAVWIVMRVFKSQKEEAAYS